MAELTEKFTTDEWQSSLMGEALFFGLLGRALYANPSRDWIAPLIEDNLFDSAPFADTQDDVIQSLALLSPWAASISAHLSDTELLDLRADYAQLFIGSNPMRVPPWESVYFSEERLTFQTETQDVHAWFERLGLQINTDYRDPDDHIAFELSFIAYCSELAFQACQDQDSSMFANMLVMQRTFLETHLLRWGIKWADLAYEHARTDFYRGLALMVRGGLKELAHSFDVDISRKIKYPGLNAD